MRPILTIAGVAAAFAAGVAVGHSSRLPPATAPVVPRSAAVARPSAGQTLVALARQVRLWEGRRAELDDQLRQARVAHQVLRDRSGGTDAATAEVAERCDDLQRRLGRADAQLAEAAAVEAVLRAALDRPAADDPAADDGLPMANARRLLRAVGGDGDGSVIPDRAWRHDRPTGNR